MATKKRTDRVGQHRTAFDKNRKRILMQQDRCAICGQLVDKTLPQYDDWSANVDHIIPIARGGHPSAMDNLQLTHRICNLKKSDRIGNEKKETSQGNELAWSTNWFDYRAQ